MIQTSDVMSLLIEVCPSYKSRYDEHYEFYYKDGQEQLLYIDLGDFADHLVDLYKSNDTKEFTKIFEIVELLHTEGDYYVKEAATIGLLEGIQNVSSNQDLDPEVFMPFLKEVSKKWWLSLINFWNGKVKFVGEDIT